MAKSFTQQRKSFVLFKHGPRHVAQVLFVVLAVVATTFATLAIAPQHKADAATSSYLNFQARLQTASGAIVPDGNYHIEFKLYDASSSGTSSQGSCSGDVHCLWTETRSTGNLVTVKNGYLTVNLGSVNALPNIDWSQQLWLTMRVGGSGGSPSWDNEMSPRLTLTALPYAFAAGHATTADTATNANDSDLLDGLDSTAFAAASGSGNYIQNQASTPQAANFYIKSNGAAGDPTAQLQLASGQSGDLLQFQDSSGNVLAGFTATGQLYLGRPAGATGSLLLRNSTNSNVVTLQSGVTTTGYTLTLPTALGSTGDCLKDGGSGALAFGSCGTSGVTTVGTFSGSSQTNGASISGSTITFGPADATNPGMVSTGAQTFAGAKTFNSTISTTQLTSTATTGTAPLVVSSTTKVANLNADSLDGLDSTAFLQNTASVQTGNLALQTPTNGTATLTLKMKSGQTAGALSIIDSNGDSLAAIDNAGGIFAQQIASNDTISAVTYGASHNVITGTQNAANATVPVMVLQGGATPGAAADLIQLRNSSSQALAGFNNAGQLYLGRASGATGSLKLLNSSNANTVTIQSGTTSSSYTLTLPTALGSTNDCLKDGGSGALVFSACASSGGVTTVGTFSGSSQANGASISGSTITFGPADATNPGMVSTGTQTFAGDKTFNGTVTSGGQVQGATLNSTGDTTVGANLSVNGTGNSYNLGALTIGSYSTGNLITNGNFETNTTGWNVHNGTQSRVSTNAYLGTYSDEFTTSATSSAGILWGTNIPVTVGKTYTFSAYVKGTSISSSASINAQVDWLGAGSSYLSTMTGSTVSLSNGWQRVTATGVAPASAQVGTAYLYTVSNTSGDKFAADGVQFELGAITPYTDSTRAAGSLTATGAIAAGGNITTNGIYYAGGSAGATVACSGGQFLQNATTVGGIVTGGSCAAASNGVTTVGTFSGTSIANGASISGNTLTLGVADATNPGMVSTTTQTFAGAKTFNSAVGIGAAASSTMLDITAGTTRGLRIINSSESAYGLMLNNTTYGSGDSNGFGFYQGNNGVAHIGTGASSATAQSVNIGITGNVGIGSVAANPSRQFTVGMSDTQTTSPMALFQQTSTGDAGIELKNANTSWFTGIDTSNGNAFALNSNTAAVSSNTVLGQNYGATAPTSTDINATSAGATKFTASASGSISALSVAFDTVLTPGTSKYSMAIYSDNGSGTAPVNLLGKYTGTTNVIAPTPGAVNWNTVTLDSPVSVTSGTVYWIAVSFTDNSPYKVKTTGGTSTYRGNVTVGTWGATWNSNGNTNLGGSTYEQGIYGSITTTNSLTDTYTNSLLTIGGTGATTFRNSTDSTGAFQVQNASSASIFTVDTVNAQVLLGASSAKTGKLLFANSSNANVVTLQSGTTTTGYTLTLPTAAGTTGQCLLAGTVASGNVPLAFGSCGGSSGVTTVGAFSASGQTNGATISTNTITFGPATASLPGMVSTTTQTFAGDKNFTGQVKANNTIASDFALQGLNSSATGLGIYGYINSNSSSNDLMRLDGSGGTVMSVKSNGATTITSGSASSLLVQNGSSLAHLTVDTTNNQVEVGSATTDANSILLVLDSSNVTTDPTGANGAMYYNSTMKAMRCYSNGAWYDCDTGSMRAEWLIKEDFAADIQNGGGGQAPNLTTGTGEYGWRLTALGGASAAHLNPNGAGNATQDNDRFAMLRIDADTSTAGTGMALTLMQKSMIGVPSNMTVEFSLGTQEAGAATGTQQVVRVGLFDAPTAATPVAAPTYGIYFAYTATTTAGNWQRCVANNGTETCTSTGVAFDTTVNNWHRFTFKTNSAGTSVEFFIDGTSVGTSSSGLPTVGSTSYGPAMEFQTTNTTQKKWKMDYYYLKRNLTTLR